MNLLKLLMSFVAAIAIAPPCKAAHDHNNPHPAPTKLCSIPENQPLWEIRDQVLLVKEPSYHTTLGNREGKFVPLNDREDPTFRMIENPHAPSLVALIKQILRTDPFLKTFTHPNLTVFLNFKDTTPVCAACLYDTSLYIIINRSFFNNECSSSNADTEKMLHKELTKIVSEIIERYTQIAEP